MTRILKLILPLTFVIFLWNCQTGNQSKLSGKIIGADGKPPVIAHIHIAEAGGNVYKPLKSVKANPDGTFEIKLPPQKYLTVLVTAPYHQALELPLARDSKTQSVELDFQLQSYLFKDPIGEVKITGDWNNFSFSSALPMQMQSDSTYVFEVKPTADTLAYQLIGLTQRELSINGTQYDYLVYDGGGDYRSVIRKTDSTMKIVFNPKELPRNYNPALPNILLRSGSLSTQEFMDIAIAEQKAVNAWRQARMNFMQKFGTDRGFRFDFSELNSFLNKKEEETGSQEVKNFIAFQRILLQSYGFSVPDSVVKKIGESVPPTDPIWSLNPQILPFVLERTFGPEKAYAMLEEALDKIDSRYTRAFILINIGMKAKYQRDNEKMASVYNKLKSDYNDMQIVQYYLIQLNPESIIAVGKPIPEFQFKSLKDGSIISNETLKGKFFIMDFWATWCKPCVGEMPYIHKAYDRYKRKNFTILSISFDRSVDDIKKFRNGKWKMPWLHTFLDKSVRDKVAQAFEVSGIPKPILVSPEGIILAMENELRGEELDKTLRKYLQ
ncbi:MAG: redoxin domain-containing protein [Calditrichaeota bacterium]|nr:redoxin domain-containing protein [Calditrichota bacterium]